VIADGDIEILFTFAPTPFSDFPQMLSAAFPNMRKEGDRLHSPGAPRLRSVYVIGDPATHDHQAYGAFVELASSEQEREVIDGLPELSVRDNFVMLYTSGTTAKPKGVLLTYVNVIGKALSFPHLYHMDASSRFWDPLPLFHIGFVWPMTGCFVARATLLAMRHFDSEAAVEMLAKERATHAYPAFQALWQPVITHASFASRDLSSLKVILHVGARDILERVQRATPHASVVSAYGLTESTGTCVHAGPDEAEEVRLGTEGRPLPGCEIRIVNFESGRLCEPDQMGEVQLRGYCVASGYYRDADRTSECFLADGWFRTGDLGSIGASGRMSFRGRLKDMLKVGGENVAALEIEQALCRHPAVSCAQVIGIPDEKYEEVAAAFVELIPGKSTTGEELIEFCASRISRFKLPRFVTFMKAWPMSATKIQKQKLKELPLGPRLIP
jgi:fatty-acyl-CoA synthase